MVAGTHGSTFGGNPLATAVGNAVLDVVAEPSFLNQVNERSEQFRTALAAIIAEFPNILEKQTGMGLMLGVKCVVSNLTFNSELTAAKLLTVKSGANSLRFLPPLNVSPEEIAQAITIIRGVCEKLSTASQ